jgi:hypothetical protein
VDQAWAASHPLPNGRTYERPAPDEVSARTMATTLSMSHGHATISNRDGLVATYVNGAVWQPTTTT